MTYGDHVHQGPDKYDWSFTDDTFNALLETGIVPIADLCHFGVPDWIGSFQDRDWPVLTEYRALLGGLFTRVYGLDAARLARIFPGITPLDLGLV